MQSPTSERRISNISPVHGQIGSPISLSKPHLDRLEYRATMGAPLYVDQGRYFHVSRTETYLSSFRQI